MSSGHHCGKRDTWATALAALALAGCSGSDLGPVPDTSGADERRRERANVEGSLFDMLGGQQIGNVTLGSPQEEDALAASVNRFLWRGALDTLAFLPLTSTDPFSGVIATDWGQVGDAAAERFKVAAYISNARLAPQSLRVAVFRQVRDDAGAWMSAPVAADTPRRIEDAILTRARQLRIAEREGGDAAG